MKGLLPSAARLVVLIAALVALAECRTQGSWPMANPGVIAAGRELLAVFETGQPARLEHYLASRTDLIVSDWLSPEARALVYDGESVRRFYPRGRSIIEIIALGDIEILSALQSDDLAVLFFVPGRYLQDADRLEFYFDEWMHKYFACYVKKAGGRWQLGKNLCFAETEGPYPMEIGRANQPEAPPGKGYEIAADSGRSGRKKVTDFGGHVASAFRGISWQR